MTTWTIPSDAHTVGDTGHTTDHNHIADCLTLIASGSAVTTYAPPGITSNISSTWTANDLSAGQICIPGPGVTLTGIAIVNGSTIAGNLLVALFNSAGTQVAVSASTAQSGSYAIQQIPFTGTYAAAAGIYYVGVMPSSSSADFATMVAYNNATTPAQGSFVMPSSITVPAATGTGGYLIHASTY